MYSDDMSASDVCCVCGDIEPIEDYPLCTECMELTYPS